MIRRYAVGGLVLLAVAGRLGALAVDLDRVLDEAVDNEALGPWLEDAADLADERAAQDGKARLLRAIGASERRLGRELSSDPGEPSAAPSEAPTKLTRRLDEELDDLAELLPKPFLPANTVCTFTSGTCVTGMGALKEQGCILVITEGESRRQLREQGAAPEADVVGLLREQGFEGVQLAMAVEENRAQSRTGFVQARQKDVSAKPLLLIDQIKYHSETAADSDEVVQVASASCRASGDLAAALGVAEEADEDEDAEGLSCFFSLVPSSEQSAEQPGHFFIHAHFGASYVTGECHVIDEE